MFFTDQDLSIIQAEIISVWINYPDLRADGFKNNEGFKNNPGAQDLLEPKSVTEFLKAFIWLSAQKKNKSIPKDRTSYGWKHKAEYEIKRIVDMYGKTGDCHISNGAFIVAAIALDFPIKRCGEHNPNCYIGIGIEREIKSDDLIQQLLCAPRFNDDGSIDTLFASRLSNSIQWTNDPSPCPI